MAERKDFTTLPQPPAAADLFVEVPATPPADDPANQPTLAPSLLGLGAPAADDGD